MGFGDTFGFYTYNSDNGNAYAVKLSTAVATAGGFEANTNPAGAPWPYGPKNMRHVWGRSGAGKRARLPLADADNDLFISGGTFPSHSVTFTVEGVIGERRPVSELGG